MELNLLDLLNRPRLHIPEAAHFHGRRVAITGAGGSIGSALAERLVGQVEFLGLLNIAEAPLFKLKQRLGGQAVGFRVCDVGRNPGEWLSEWGIDTVLHAAAHKHVGLMESQPDEAFRNNTQTTMRLATAAESVGARMVLISTDKAANPTCVMGASKRLAEAWLLTHHENFGVCRFGNVIGSSGSVVEIVHDNLLAGDPVTLTSTDMKRFFITPNEAVDLVLATAGECGGLYTLNMGEQVSVELIIRRVAQQMGKPLELLMLGQPTSGEKEVEDLLNPGETAEAYEGSALMYIDWSLSQQIINEALEGFISGRTSLVEAANSL
jgi:FlaA1/EpsC-like NDP-sugar epimerase